MLSVVPDAHTLAFDDGKCSKLGRLRGLAVSLSGTEEDKVIDHVLRVGRRLRARELPSQALVPLERDDGRGEALGGNRVDYEVDLRRGVDRGDRADDGVAPKVDRYDVLCI